jgi:hypothetical protein
VYIYNIIYILYLYLYLCLYYIILYFILLYYIIFYHTIYHYIILYHILYIYINPCENRLIIIPQGFGIHYNYWRRHIWKRERALSLPENRDLMGLTQQICGDVNQPFCGNIYWDIKLPIWLWVWYLKIGDLPHQYSQYSKF